MSNGRGDRAATWDIEPLNSQEIDASRVAPAPAGQPFGPLLLTPMPWTAEAIPGATPGDVPKGAALDGAGRRSCSGTGRCGDAGPPRLTDRTARARGTRLADACAGGGGRLAADPSSTVAAIAYQGRPHGLWITYRDAAAPALEATPRICDLRWSPQLPGAHRARAGRIKLYLRLSKPVARIVVTVRGRHRRVLSNTRLGPRPVGYTSVTLRGPHSALTLPPGRYSITARAADTAGRRSRPTSINLRVVRPSPRTK